MPKKYTPELRERAVRMVLERQVAEGGPRSHSIRAVAPQLGVGEETLRMWCNRHGHEITQTPAGEDLQQENKRLKRELAEARRANEMADSSSQRNESCEMRQLLITGGSGCRASTAISAGSRSSSHSGFTRRAGGWSTSPRRSAAVRRWSASWPGPAGTSTPSRSAGNHARAT
ncbi:transposase [Micrococcus luteus]|uniref:transposase n=1 Tax=Micrococcus luteus TaxID=1270 RepID=UPI003B969ED4